jgi:hypothetical protein
VTVLIASTTVPYKVDDGLDRCWLTHAAAWRAQGHDVFCALQDMAGLSHRFAPLEARLSELGAWVWRFAIAEPGLLEIDSNNRLIGICTGRNLAHEFAANRRRDYEAILFLDTDVTPPVDLVDRLLEIPRPLVGSNIGIYCLGISTCRRCDNGVYWDDQACQTCGMPPPHIDPPYVPFGPGGHHLIGCPYPQPDYTRPLNETYGEPEHQACTCGPVDVREHWTSAGALLVRRGAYRRLRWRWDRGLPSDAKTAQPGGNTDDPCFQQDAVDLGFGQTWTRHDVTCDHLPIGPVETRGHDMRASA